MVNLLNNNKFTNIRVVVNYFMKMRHIILIDLINTISITKRFIKYIFKLYKLSNLIISDYKN